MVIKRSIYVIIVFLCLGCKAQIAPLYKADPDLPEGTYYKDLDNDLNKFEGTWVWQEGNTALTFIVEKKVQILNPSGVRSYDILEGEYQYIENGIEVVNFLSRLDDESIKGFSHYLSGNRIMHKNHPPLKCNDCTTDERRVQMYFEDPLTPYISNQVILRHIVVGGEERLQATLMGNGTVIVPDGSPQMQRVPYGAYILIKQN